MLTRSPRSLCSALRAMYLIWVGGAGWLPDIAVRGLRPVRSPSLIPPHSAAERLRSYRSSFSSKLPSRNRRETRPLIRTTGFTGTCCFLLTHLRIPDCLSYTNARRITSISTALSMMKAGIEVYEKRPCELPRAYAPIKHGCTDQREPQGTKAYPTWSELSAV
jgi:hypothetical protein